MQKKSVSRNMILTLRNCVRKRVLSCVNGAFAERWYKSAVDNGLEADRL